MIETLITKPDRYWKTASQTEKGDLVFIGMRYHSSMTGPDKWVILYQFAYENAVVITRSTFVVTGTPDNTIPDHNKLLIQELPGDGHNLVVQSEHEAYVCGYNSVIPGANKYTPDNFYEKHPDPEEKPYWETYIEQFFTAGEGRYVHAINPTYIPEVVSGRI